MTAVDDFIANLKQYHVNPRSGPMQGDIALFIAALQQLATGGGGATPGGPTTAIQFNTAGAFAGSAELKWNGSNIVITDDAAGVSFTNTDGTTNSIGFGAGPFGDLAIVSGSGGRDINLLPHSGTVNIGDATQGMNLNVFSDTSQLNISIGGTGTFTYNSEFDFVFENSGGNLQFTTDTGQIIFEAATIVRANNLTLGNATNLVSTDVALTNHAAAQAATLLNGPVAGNPTLWGQMTINGVAKFFPLW